MAPVNSIVNSWCVQELALIGLLGYMSYLLADVLGLSGILSCFVCAILVSHYALHNVSREGRETTMNAFKTLSYLAEGMIFIYVGMDALDPLKWKVRELDAGMSCVCIYFLQRLCSDLSHVLCSYGICGIAPAALLSGP